MAEATEKAPRKVTSLQPEWGRCLFLRVRFSPLQARERGRRGEGGLGMKRKSQGNESTSTVEGQWYNGGIKSRTNRGWFLRFEFQSLLVNQQEASSLKRFRHLIMDLNRYHSTFNETPHHWSPDATSTRAVVDDLKGRITDQAAFWRRDIIKSRTEYSRDGRWFRDRGCVFLEEGVRRERV